MPEGVTTENYGGDDFRIGMAVRKAECMNFRQSLACYYQCGNEGFMMRKRV